MSNPIKKITIPKNKKLSRGFRQWWADLSALKKSICIVLTTLIALILFLVLWAVIHIRSAKTIYSESLAAKQSFEFAQADIGEQNFDRAKKNLQEADAHFQEANNQLQKFGIFKIVPGVRPQIKAVENVLQAGQSLSVGLIALTDVGAKVNGVLSQGDASFNDISPEDKRDILQALSESDADLQGVKANIELASVLIEEIPDKGLLKPVHDATASLKQELPALQTVVHQVIPLAQSLPTILGYPKEKNYLFLLQNNRELRPTGGFIGTLAHLTLDAGEIKTFETDNIYNLDNQAKNTVTEPSPAPIAKHTSTQNWLLRDINWSPDFPTTAKKAEEKYHEEGGQEENLDGVIAVTPTFIEDLLRVTGPVTVDGIEFTAENLFYELEEEAEFGYAEKGIDDSDRKEIINHLSSELLKRIMGLPSSKFPDLVKTFQQSVNEKQILITVHDQITQSLIIDQNWAGEMKSYNGDYLMVVDANLAALKTDESMEKTLSYTVSQEDGKYIGEANMHYKNNGNFDKFHTRYRTHTRIYLPQGAQLIESAGFMTGDKTQGGKPVDPEVYDETFTQANGKTTTYTVVAGFTSIEPQEEGDLRVKYVLPEGVVKQIENKDYHLYVQKQSGTIEYGLNTSFDVGKKIDSADPLDLGGQIVDNKVSFGTNLRTDRDFNIKLK